MDMQQVTRFSLIVLLAAGIPRGLRAMEDGNMAAPVAKPTSEAKPAATAKAPLLPAEYKRTDMNFYPKAELLKIRPDAVILPKGRYEEHDGSYYFTPKVRAPKEVFIENVGDWIEPITPPDMPASLGVPPDAMQIREPQGDVQVALPSAPASFSPVTDNMTLPNGAVVKTGANGTAAVLFGGVDSARLMPNSAAAMQQTVTVNSRSVEVDLTSGGVFSKVGTQVGVKGSYEVHTPSGNAGAAGGDFATIIAAVPAPHTDIWVAQGTVAFENDGKVVGSVTSNGAGELKLLRSVSITDPNQAVQADSETLSAALNFIPLANQKLKALRDKQAAGTALTPNEHMYFGRIRQVPSLIKLDLVPPPAPVVATPPPAEAPAPITPAPAPAPVPAAPKAVATKKPLNVNIHSDGTIGFRGAKMDLPAFQAKLADIGKATPDQAFLLHAGSDVTDDKIQPVMDGFHAAGLEKVTMAPRPVVKAPAIIATPAPAPPPVPAAPAVAAETPAPAPAETPAPPPAAPEPPKAVATKKPLSVNIHADGTVGFRGVKMDLPAFQAKLAAIGKATPEQAFMVHAAADVTDDKITPVMDSFHAAGLENATLAPRPVATAPAAPSAPSTETPAPTIAADVPAPHLALPPETPSAPAAPAPEASEKPLIVTARADGRVRFNGATTDLPTFQAKLADIAKATPDQAFVVRGSPTVPYEKIQAIMDSFHAANLDHVTIAPHTGEAAPATASTPETPAAPAPEAPAPAIAADVPAPHLSVPTPEPTASTPAPVATKKPLNVNIHSDGTVGFRGSKMDLAAFQAKLADIGKATPDQAFLVHAAADVPDEKIQPVMDSFHAAGLERATLAPKPVAPAQPALAAIPVAEPVKASAKPPVAKPVAADEAPALHLTAPKVESVGGPSVEVRLHSNGRMEYQDDSVTLDQLRSKLSTLDAGRMVILEQDENTEQIDSDKVVEIINDLKLKSKILKVPESDAIAPTTQEAPKVGP